MPKLFERHPLAPLFLMMLVACAASGIRCSATTWPYLQARKNEDKQRNRQLAAIMYVVEVDESCEKVSKVSATSKGFFGEITGTDSLMKEALRDLRQQASDLGVTHLQLTNVEQHSNAHLITSSFRITLTATGFVCPDGAMVKPWPLRRDLF